MLTKIREIANIYANFINQKKFKCQTVFSTRFDKQDEDEQVLDELAICNILKIIRILTESETDNFDVRSRLEQQIQNQESKDSGWRFGSTKSMAT